MIRFCQSEFCHTGCVPGNIYWGNILEHLFALDNSRDEKFPMHFPGIVWYFSTYNGTDCISSYMKGLAFRVKFRVT